MLKKLLVLLLITFSLSQIATADTNIDILAEIVLKKNKRLFIDKGRIDGVEIGHKLDILYDGRNFGSAIISWVGEDISYARVDSATFYRYYYIEPLEAKIYLVRPSKYEGGTVNVPFYRRLYLTPSEIMMPDEQAVACLLYDGLVRMNDQGNIIPGLAHTWEVHGNTYTFHLNSEVKFHTGKYLDALDVAYSLVQLARAPTVTPASSFILEVDGYDEVHSGRKNELRGVFIPNKYSIAITTKDTFIPFLKYMAGPGGYIIPSLERSPVPVGTGPFKVARINDNRITLAANTDFFETRPVVDSVIFSRYENRKEAALDFELGRLDLIYFDSQEDRDLLTGGDYSSRRYYTSSMVLLGFQCGHEYQKDYKLAKALQYLFDKESIVRVLLGNSARKSDGLTPPSLGIEPETTTDYYFMPSEAKTRIAEIENLPKQLNLVYDNTDPMLESVANYISGQLRHADFKIKIQQANSRHLEKSTALSSMDFYLFRTDLIVPDADAFFYPTFSGKLNGRTNYLNYDNPQLERFLDGARRLDDDYVRTDIYRETEKLLMESPPAVSLYNAYMTAAFRRDLGGFKPDLRAYVNLREIFFQAGK
ncbi:MAG: ABC transporter substrate-binding protein [candidate division Zixibacteria bacterium]|nr:ABC transporter substrate-binding protein [candidate division Zixibacteria bacterium]